ncbi:homocysteine S-methyltransferase [Lutimonas sp.]|uniref:homocysteine S-methyltransferase n=1 Tax=Lutimonas sp. TaxID=1872403 RepID=UPI003D9BFC2E
MKNQPSPIILDGGLSNVLESMGCDLNHPLWTAKLIETHPDLLIKTHLIYLEAGARIISSAGYQASIEGYLSLGKTKEEAIELIAGSLDLVLRAKKLYIEKNRPDYLVQVAASMGPYGAFLADGSEYSGDYKISDRELTTFHQSRIEIYENKGADYLAFETIPSFQEVKVLSKLLDQCPSQSWVSFSCKNDSQLNDGTQISDAVSLLSEHPTIFALGVNCTAPKYMTTIIATIKEYAPQKKIIIYPNSGEVYHADSKTWSGISDPLVFEKMALEWSKKGADIIGGCCRIGPEHIAKLSRVK